MALISGASLGNAVCNSLYTSIIRGIKSSSSDTHASTSLVAYGSDTSKYITAKLSLQDENNPSFTLSTTGISQPGVRMSGIADPVDSQDIATRGYIDTKTLALDINNTEAYTASKVVTEYNEYVNIIKGAGPQGNASATLTFNDVSTPMLKLENKGNTPIGPYCNGKLVNTRNYIRASPSLFNSPQGLYASMTEEQRYVFFGGHSLSINIVKSDSLDISTDYFNSTSSSKFNIRCATYNRDTASYVFPAKAYKLTYMTQTVAPFDIKVYMYGGNESVENIVKYMENTDSSTPNSLTPGWTLILTTTVNTFNTIQEVNFTTTTTHSMASIVISGPSKLGLLTLSDPIGKYEQSLSSTLTAENGNLEVHYTNPNASANIIGIIPNVLYSYVSKIAVNVIRSTNNLVLTDKTNNIDTTLTATSITLRDANPLNIVSTLDVNNNIMQISNNNVTIGRRIAFHRRFITLYFNTNRVFTTPTLVNGDNVFDFADPSTTIVSKNITGSNPFTIANPNLLFPDPNTMCRLSFICRFTTNITNLRCQMLFVSNNTDTTVIQDMSDIPTGKVITYSTSGISRCISDGVIKFVTRLTTPILNPGDEIVINSLNLSIEEMIDTEYV